MTRSRVFAVLAVLVTVFIFAASAQNGEDSAAVSSGVLTFFLSFLGKFGLTVSHYFVRKAAHFSEFFAQSLFLSLSARYSAKGLRPHISDIAFAGLLTACCDEFSQYFSVGRSAQVSDIFIDFGGTLAALILIAVITELLKRRAQNV